MMQTSERLLNRITEGRQYRPTAELLRVKRKEEEDEKEDEKEDDKYGEMVVEGHASTFNQPYRLYEDDEYVIDEQVDPAAFDECDMSDVIFQYNHEGRVFARTRNSTLELSTDENGLYVRANLGGTEEGRKLYQEIQDGYTDRMSFGFTVTEDRIDEDTDKEAKKTRVLRTITRIGKLYDVSAVSIPANDGTDISARSFCDGLLAKLEAERLEARNKLNADKAKAVALLNL